jgi:hypothetical protein
MAYDVNKTNGSLLTTIPDGTLDVSTSLRLLGKNYAGYGEIMAENLVAMLENFSSAAAPSNPLQGQLWFNSETNRVSVYDELGQWKELAQLLVQETEPTYSGRRAGDFWVESGTKQLYMWTGTEHVPIGFAGAKTTIRAVRIRDTLNNLHDALKATVNNSLIAIISTDAEYTPNASEGFGAEFVTIGPGVNLPVRANVKFRGIAMQAEFADVAELYASDVNYAPGTVVKLGGDEEITQTTSADDANVFGVISTNPAYLLNSGLARTKLALPVALDGRVPITVVGPVKKGDRLVSSDIPGTAKACANPAPFTVIGRSLTTSDDEGVRTVEAVVGVN